METVKMQCLGIKISICRKFRFPVHIYQIEESCAALRWIREILQKLYPHEQLSPFYELLLKAETPINITTELHKTFKPVNSALNDAYELAMKQALLGTQLRLVTDKSFRSAGYALMIKDYPEPKIQLKRKLTLQ